MSKERRCLKMSILNSVYWYSRQMYAAYKSYEVQYKINKRRQVRFYNWWDEPYEQLWLYRFVIHRNIVSSDKILNFISVFGKKEVADFLKKGAVVFYTGENVHNSYHLPYTNCLLDKRNVKLAVGFDWLEESTYIRFPLWIPFMFDPILDEMGIMKRCEELRYPPIGERDKFATLVARYDWNGTRSQIYDSLKHIAPISCPSLVLHNDDDLKSKFADNKMEYMRQFSFNICPENSNSYGYVTEKLFQSIDAGCIPIYWGSYNMPEVDVLNQDAIIKWNMHGDNSANVALINDMYAHPDMLREFMVQPRLLPQAEEQIIGMINKLEQKLRELVC